MSGRFLILGFIAFVTLFGIALWWFQTRAFYEDISMETVLIENTSYPSSEFRGINAESSPLKLRACFRLEGPVSAEPFEAATPLIAPGWFDCFDARVLEEDLSTGAATAYLGAAEEFDGIDRVVAVYPDGRAFMWRQLNERYAR